MKKKTKILIASFLLTAATALTACGTTGSSEDEDENVTSMDLFRWDFAYINTARKMGSPIYKAFKEKVGVDINAITTGSADWKDTINRRFKTGELPDMFISEGPDAADLYYDMIRDEAIVPVSDYVNEESYPNLNEHLKKYDFLKDNLYYSQGKHWSVPVEWSLEWTFYVREDWIDNLNETTKLTAILTDELGHVPNEDELEAHKFKEPDTLVEFYRLARAFRYYDPDGNGEDDTWGYSSSDCYSDNWIYEAFGGYNHMQKDSSGKYTNGCIEEGNKKAIAFINRLIKEDIMHPDWVTDDVDGKQTKFMQGKVGMMLCHAWYNTIVQGFMSAHFGETLEGATSKIGLIKPPANQDGKRGINSYPNFWTVICIKNDMSKAKIKKALDILEFLHSKEGSDLFIYGIEGTHYDVVEGQKVSKMGQNAKGFNYTLLGYDKAAYLGTYGNWSQDYYSPYATNAEKIIAAMDGATECGVYDDLPFFQTPLYTQYQGSLKEYFSTTSTNMVRDSDYYSESYYKSNEVWMREVTWDNLFKVNESLDTDFASYVSNYLGKYKGQEVINEYNEYASQLNSSKEA